ncbi:multicopper oxidase domain-containing protein [Caldicoprobacter algeriensis]|uniref:multicopper oxidase family protein n=1 Tax=Caldicoprobacter algeriensis TaxID=699281 RepID=UPI00207A8979|nr:multicopper oxidase [Caldicoprobacter algeriensis]MCM8900724.1 multicopper oxidase domain-containing protein [Caldicoprobacter algeriensis]
MSYDLNDNEYYEYKVDPSDPNSIPKFVDELPIPDVLQPTKRLKDGAYYEVKMLQVKQKLHKCFPETTVWGYNGTYPGPTIETLKDRTVMVKWINCLPKKHLLPVDRTLHGAIDTPEVRTVVHLHGARVSPDSDGHPEAWFTQGFKETGPHFSTEVYKYTNHQQAATLWYHDHALGITRLNVYSGLAGFYIIRDHLEPMLNLPSGEYEIPLLIQDRSFNKDGSLFYPAEPPQPVPGVFPSVVPIFFGNTILVNGKVWPYLNVEPRKYRFRILNGSNSRTYTLRLSNGQKFYQIGTDGGLLESPVELDALTIMPAERADIIIDFSGSKGEYIILTNDDTDENTRNVMQFRVVLPLKDEDISTIPETLYPIERLNENMATKVRNLTLDAVPDRYGRPSFQLDGKTWHDPVAQMPELGSIEIWNFLNLIAFPHPIHVHLVQFQILDRRPFDVQHYRSTGEIKYTGDPIPPDPNERGWKDTVRVTPGQVTRIIAKFDGYTGDYVWHCHILEHEDHDMMRPFRVIKNYCS